MVDSQLAEIISRGLELESAISQHDDYDAVWEHLAQARTFGRRAFDAAIRLLEGDTLQRTLGCDLLSVLCNPDSEGWSHEATVAISAMAQEETDPDCCWSIAEALGFTEDPDGAPVLLRLASHADPDVRFNVAMALPACTEIGQTVDPEIVETLAQLMDDPIADVRDWATFGLGQVLEVDSCDLREHFLRRLEDDHDDTRLEALIGLARRRDPRALAFVKAALGADSVFRLAVAAAQYLADPELIPNLIALRPWWDVDPDLLEEAIEACDPTFQADKLRVLERLFVEVGRIEGISLTVSCDLYETYVSIEAVQADGRTRLWSLDELIARTEGQCSIGEMILADLT